MLKYFPVLSEQEKDFLDQMTKDSDSYFHKQKIDIWMKEGLVPLDLGSLPNPVRLVNKSLGLQINYALINTQTEGIYNNLILPKQKAELLNNLSSLLMEIKSEPRIRLYKIGFKNDPRKNL